MGEWRDGRVHQFVGRGAGTNRLEIIGTLGKLILENNRLVFTRNAADMIGFSRTAKQGFVKPDAKEEEILFENAVVPHAIMMQNFVNAISTRTAHRAGRGRYQFGGVGECDGLFIVARSNSGTAMDGAAWEKKLNQMIAESKAVKKVVKVATDDFASSFKK